MSLDHLMAADRLHSARRVARRDGGHRASGATPPMGRYAATLGAGRFWPPGVVGLHLWWGGTTACNPPGQRPKPPRSKDANLSPFALGPTQEPDMSYKTNKIAFQGDIGANSDMACRDMFPDLEAAALQHLRGRLQRGHRRRGGSRHDPDRKYDRRSRRRHPLSSAGIAPAHYRRIFHADPFPADGPAGHPVRGTSRPCTATSMPSVSAATSCAIAVGARWSPAIPPVRPGWWPIRATSRWRPYRRGWPPISTGSTSWKKMSRTATPMSPDSSSFRASLWR